MIYTYRAVFTISDRFNENYIEDNGTTAKKKEGGGVKWLHNRSRKRNEKMKGLKKELEMDQHEIPLEELCTRLRTHAKTVRIDAPP